VIARDPASLMLLMLVAPFVCAALLPLFRSKPNLREAVTLLAGVVVSASALLLLPAVLQGSRPAFHAFNVASGLTIGFRIEPLGMLFAAVASVLWLANSIYSIGYMRAHDEPRQTTFYVCFAIAFGSTMGIAFAANLFTLFLFYEALTLSTYPLVTHNRTPEAIRGGRIYLLILLSTSMLLFLPAIIATWMIAGTLEFADGGTLAGRAGPLLIAILLALYVFGIGKAAVMPVHFWLPAAMVAPTPVSAFLHAVAVVKAGVFAVVKVVVYVFGLETLTASGANTWLVVVACASVLVAGLVALRQDNLKARLAYSTVSQLAYVVLGASLATSSGIIGSGLQIATHAAAKITLFFCAGAIHVAAHKTRVSELDGIGRQMPITMGAFFIASLSLVGLPPLGGTWSKWQLMLASLDAGSLAVVGVLMLSSLLSLGYLIPVPLRAFLRPANDGVDGVHVIREAPLPCLLALCATTLLAVLLFFIPGAVTGLLLGVAGGPR
jgi:multicomponent Na+:H+ antiporter subunit D